MLDFLSLLLYMPCHANAPLVRFVSYAVWLVEAASVN